MRSITSFAVRQHRFPNANENDICAFGAKWCSSLRSEIRPYGSWSPFPQGKAYGYRKTYGRAYTLNLFIEYNSRMVAAACREGRRIPKQSYLRYPLLFSVHCPLSTVHCHRPLRSSFSLTFPISHFPREAFGIRYS